MTFKNIINILENFIKQKYINAEHATNLSFV